MAWEPSQLYEAEGYALSFWLANTAGVDAKTVLSILS